MARSPLTVFDRDVALGRLAEEEFDVLVIGGGITGSGVALDAAARGLRTALVERDDFASGTSSKSSKLIHGGLRYLQQREFALVHENLVERHRLLHNAPHLVEPLSFLIPLFGKGGAVNKTLVHGYSFALWMYDLTGGWKIGKRHRKVTAAEIAAHLPTLRQDRLVAGFVYYDARADDARLTLAVARTAALDHGAVVVNHSPAVRLLTGGAGAIEGAVVRPTGGEAEIDVRARTVVNAAGIWGDEVRALETGENPGAIRPAKGIHLTVAREKLPCDMAAIIPVPGDRRSIFVIPWGDHTYLGTTDTDYQGSLDDPRVDDVDVDYILGAINAAVAEPLRREDVTGSWAGLRPLLAAAPGRTKAPSARTADLSRRHQVIVSDHGLVTITGGKLTTYRKMAADTVDAVGERLGRKLGASPTRKMRLRGAEGLDALERSTTATSTSGGLGPETLSHLRGRYGGESRVVMALAGERPDLGLPLVDGLPYLRAEAVYAVRYEMAIDLDDVLARRTRAVLLDAEAAISAARSVAELIAGELGWTPDEIRTQVERFRSTARADLTAMRSAPTPEPAS
jgi:glycerol-3-phosphate dehydrogenase